MTVNKELIDKSIGTLFDNSESIIVMGTSLNGEDFCFMAGEMDKLIELVKSVDRELGE
jgi:hypothetical protein